MGDEESEIEDVPDKLVSKRGAVSAVLLVLKNPKQIKGLNFTKFVEPHLMPLVVTLTLATYSFTSAENRWNIKSNSKPVVPVKPEGQTLLKETFLVTLFFTVP